MKKFINKHILVIINVTIILIVFTMIGCAMVLNYESQGTTDYDDDDITIDAQNTGIWPDSLTKSK